jgi:hydroxylamine reductase (hybrid-cluster protein)
MIVKRKEKEGFSLLEIGAQRSAIIAEDSTLAISVRDRLFAEQRSNDEKFAIVCVETQQKVLGQLSQDRHELRGAIENALKELRIYLSPKAEILPRDIVQMLSS